MKFKRLLLVSGLGTAVMAMAFAAAASMDIDNHTVQAGSSELACQESTLTLSNFNVELDTQTFDRFRVNNIDAACEGARVIVRIYDEVGGTNDVCSNAGNVGTVGSGESSHLVNLNGPCNVQDAEEVRVLFQDP